MSRDFELFDTHAHLGDDGCPDEAEFYRRAEDAGVPWILLCGSDFDSSRRAAEFASHVSRVYFAAGLHGLDVEKHPCPAEAFEPFDSDYASKERQLYNQIHQTVFDELRAAGDDNIYYLDGRMLYGADFDECTVDGAHATDLGSYRIAHALAPVIERILHRWW